MPASPARDVLKLMTLCGLAGPSWASWRIILTGFLGGTLAPEDLDVWRTVTGRMAGPTAPGRELWVIAGRRSGKSLIAALLAVYVATCRTYRLAPGEVPTLMVLAADRRQARVVRRYIGGLLRAAPALTRLVASETSESVTLTSDIVIEVHTASAASVRGYTCIGIICDELAFWATDEDSADADAEVLNALRPALATTGGPLIAISTAHLKRGEVWRAYEQHYGTDDDPVVVVQAPSLTLNPTLDRQIVADAMANDAAKAAAEWGGTFRSDLEAFVRPDVIAACIERGCVERGALTGVTYAAFVDPAGGSGTDSFTTTVAHAETHGGTRVIVQDALHEARPPFSPEAVVAESAALCRRYQVSRVLGDRYAGEWPREAYRRHGLLYDAAPLTASEAYQETLPILNTGRVRLLDHPRLVAQLGALERRASRSGRILISHPPHRHDDCANVAALAIASMTSRVSTNALQGLTW